MLDDGWLYFGGVDIARGGMSGGDSLVSGHTGDDFAMATWRWRPDHPKAQLVSFFRQTGIELPQMSAVAHRHEMKYGYTYIVADPGGGGIFLRDDLRKPIQDDGSTTFAVQPLISEGDERMAGLGKPIIVWFKRGEPKLEKAGMIYQSESHLPNVAHTLLRAGFQQKKIELPQKWPHWGLHQNTDAQLRWLNEMAGLPPMERAQAEIDLALAQLYSIERDTDKAGNPEQDRFGNFKFDSRRKKDSAYAMMYGYFGICLYETWLSQEKTRSSQIEAIFEFTKMTW